MRGVCFLKKDEMKLYYIWLENIKGLGPKAWHEFLHAYGNPEFIFQGKGMLRPKGKVTEHQIGLLQSGADQSMEEAKRILDRCLELKIQIVTFEDSYYMPNLKEYMDFPIVFYAKGCFREDWTHGCGIVGSRRCSEKGKEMAIQRTVQEIKKGHPIISGMAKGIDSYAHTAAVKNSGYTIAVLAYGIDLCYPPEHRRLKEIIAEKGLIISEYPPGTSPHKYNFPLRNRIIAGLSDTLYVVDTGVRSGTETTIRAAQKYGKRVEKITN